MDLLASGMKVRAAGEPRPPETRSPRELSALPTEQRAWTKAGRCVDTLAGAAVASMARPLVYRRTDGDREEYAAQRGPESRGKVEARRPTSSGGMDP